MSRKKYYDYDDPEDLDRGYDRHRDDDYNDDYDDYEGSYYQQKKPKTEKEAKRVMERAKDKKFWNCDDVDNFNSLKGAIDLMYNSVPGNNYAVKYQENQNGTRLTIVCETCDKTLSSYDPFLSHENGKNHKKARQQKLTPPDPNLKKQPKNRKINTPRDIFFEDTLEEMIDHCKYTTIGVHFLYKEVIDRTEYFTCTLCKRSSNCERISKKKMYSHITGKTHMKNYMEVKHGFKKRELEEEAKYIEQYEGKIHHKITDFTNQLEIEEKYSKKLYKDIKREKSSSSSSSDSDSSHSSSPRRQRKFKRSPSSRRYSPSPSRSYRSKRSKSQSPIRKFKRSPSSRRYSPSPARSYKSRRSRSHSPVRARSPAPVLPPPKPSLADGFSVVDHTLLPGRNIHTLCNYITDESIKEDCLNVISEDTDMQNLIIHALYVLNSKVDVHYKENGMMFHDGSRFCPLTEKSEEMHNFICLLKAVTREE